MAALSYYLTLPFLYFFSVLPMPVLYFLSDIIVYPLVYHVFGYRKGVVRNNLANAFPEKTEKERKSVEKKFYHYLSDLMMETVKGFTISRKSLKNRFSFVEENILPELYAENQSMILTLGHYGNYEWACLVVACETPHKTLVPYRKLANPYFDRLFTKSRGRFGVEMFHTYKTNQVLQHLPTQPYILGLANDQSAPPGKSYWTSFLHQDTSFFVGTEKIAREKNLPVYFVYLFPNGRGKYAVKFTKICQNPADYPVGYIMQQHTELLEQQIRENPAYWLWSHRRWKHKMPEGTSYGFQTELQ